jgi:hypothetical protein
VKSNRAIQKLRDHAAQSGLAQVELAAELGVPSGTLNGWIYDGKTPRASLMRRLAAAGYFEPNDWYLPPLPEPADSAEAIAAPQAAE